MWVAHNKIVHISNAGKVIGRHLYHWVIHFLQYVQGILGARFYGVCLLFPIPCDETESISHDFSGILKNKFIWLLLALLEAGSLGQGAIIRPPTVLSESLFPPDWGCFRLTVGDRQCLASLLHHLALWFLFSVFSAASGSSSKGRAER